MLPTEEDEFLNNFDDVQREHIASSQKTPKANTLSPFVYDISLRDDSLDILPMHPLGGENLPRTQDQWAKLNELHA